MTINFKGSHYPKDVILYAVFLGEILSNLVYERS